ncbi:hypothetical protein JCM10550A_11420 [Methanogenium cariaci]
MQGGDPTQHQPFVLVERSDDRHKVQVGDPLHGGGNIGSGHGCASVGFGQGHCFPEQTDTLPQVCALRGLCHDAVQYPRRDDIRVEARKDLLTYIEKKQSEQNATTAMIKTVQNISQRQADILRQMMEHREQYFTIREISETHGVVYQTARTDLLGLAGKGYIRKEKRGREFMFIFNEDGDAGNRTEKPGR